MRRHPALVFSVFVALASLVIASFAVFEARQSRQALIEAETRIEAQMALLSSETRQALDGVMLISSQPHLPPGPRQARLQLSQSHDSTINSNFAMMSEQFATLDWVQGQLGSINTQLSDLSDQIANIDKGRLQCVTHVNTPDSDPTWVIMYSLGSGGSQTYRMYCRII